MYEKIKFQLHARNVRWREEFEHFKKFKQRIFIGGVFSFSLFSSEVRSLSDFLSNCGRACFEFYLNGWCALLSLRRGAQKFQKDV